MFLFSETVGRRETRIISIKKFATIAQRFGFIISLIALLLVFSNYPVEKNIIGIIMIIALIIGVLGGLLGGMSKIMLLALCISLLSVVIYFYFSNGILFKICLFISILLLPIDFFVKKKTKVISLSN
jgi:hypothetical protein